MPVEALGMTQNTDGLKACQSHTPTHSVAPFLKVCQRIPTDQSIRSPLLLRLFSTQHIANAVHDVAVFNNVAQPAFQWHVAPLDGAFDQVRNRALRFGIFEELRDAGEHGEGFVAGGRGGAQWCGGAFLGGWVIAAPAGWTTAISGAA